MSSQVKSANDLISDSVDAFFSGDEDVAGQYLEEALNQKMTERMHDCLSKLPEFNVSQQ